MDNLKLCKVCNETKQTNNFYIAYRNNDKIVYTSLCKPCHNAKKTIYNRAKPKIVKPNGFMKLDEIKRNQILEDIKNKIKFMEIAKKQNIKYSLILTWKRKGYFDITPTNT